MDPILATGNSAARAIQARQAVLWRLPTYPVSGNSSLPLNTCHSILIVLSAQAASREYYLSVIKAFLLAIITNLMRSWPSGSAGEGRPGRQHSFPDSHCGA